MAEEQRERPEQEEEPLTIREDEPETFDLGFIIEDRSDTRDSLLSRWQRLDDTETEGSGETTPAARDAPEATDPLAADLPRALFRHGDRSANEAAERSESEFARRNSLSGDPDEELRPARPKPRLPRPRRR